MIEQQEKQPQQEEAFVGLMMSEKNGKFRQINKDTSLDSCLLFIDAKKCSNISEELTRTTCLVEVDSDTGEIINTISTIRNEAAQHRAISYSKCGITYTFAYKCRNELRGKNNSIYKEYITCAVSSKMLGSQYLQGINTNTVEALYNNIMKQGLFTCSLSTFLQAKASDTDYKRDTYIDTDKYTNFIKHLYTNVRESYVNVAINKFSSQKANTGLQIGRRGDKKVSLLKFYNKSEELINHSTEFNNKYVGLHNSPRTIMRVELTVNGQKEAQRKGLITNKESYTLSKIMQLCAEKTTINTIFANEINSRIVTTNNNNNNCEAMKSKAVEAVKDKKFPKAQSNTIYEVCYYGTLNNSFTLADCQSYASMILNCSEAYRERFLSIAYAVAKRAYEDASVQSGRAKVVIHDDTVMGLFGLQN